MLKKFFHAFRHGWKRPINVFIVPISTIPSLKLKFSLPFLVFMFLVWTGVTLWSGYMAGKTVDYYVTKADNRILSEKMNRIAKGFDATMEYLNKTRKMEKELQAMLGAGDKTKLIVNSDLKVENPNSEKTQEFMAKQYSGFSDNFFHVNFTKISNESKRLLSSFQEMTWYLANERNVYKATPSIWPTYGRISSGFGYRISPFTGFITEFHSGLDIVNDPNTPIYATANGVVRFTGWAYGYGQAILIDHGFGYSTLYGHTTEIKVHEGEHVVRGQEIAKMGMTGRSTGPHLHYEVWENGKAVNPKRFLKDKRPTTKSQLLTQI
jgi:murein DD-endopeptidase MepM/ murein hydrolase activator NlpD